MKVEKLTPAQEALLPKYVEKGIEIGLAVGADINEAEIEDLTNKHRELCGVDKASTFLVYDSPFAVCEKYKDCTPGNALYGQHDINWLIHHAFFRVECGLIEETEKIKYLLELASKIGWMWMSGDTTIVTRRPEEIHVKATGSKVGLLPLQVLHNESGMALRYRDGQGLYCLEGLRIPGHYITEPYDIQKVMKEPNVELRNVLLKMGGPNVLELHCNKKVLEAATIQNGGEYELYTISIDDNTRVYLKGMCPSKGEPFNEAVPPSIKSVEAGLHWREWGSLPIAEVGGAYLVPKVRT